MNQREPASLNSGELVWVRCGSFGRQIARVLTVTRTGKVRVRKWLMSSRRWTKAVTIARGDVLYKVHEEFLSLDLPLVPGGRPDTDPAAAHPDPSNAAAE